MRRFKRFNKRGKNGQKYITKRDIVIIAILVLVNIFILGYGKIKDRNLSKELKKLQETMETKPAATSNKQETETKNAVLAKEVKNKGFVLPRNANLEKALEAGKLKGLIFGDAIGQGLSPETNNTFLSEEIGSRVYQAINKLSKDSLMPENYSVGGSTIENTLAYLGDNEGKKSKAFDYSYWIFITGKNEMETMTPQQFKTLYKMAVSIGEKNGIEVICCTEPPVVELSSGTVIADNYAAYKKVIEEVAAEEGATYIDIYGAYLKKKEGGENLSKLTSTGVIPNASGYKYICELITEGIVGTKVEYTKAQGNGAIKLMATYKPIEEITKTQINNLSSKATTREFNSGDKNAIALNSGKNLTFKVPEGEVVGVIVSAISNENSGTLNVKTKTGILNKSLKLKGSLVKEVSQYISLENNQDIKNSKELILAANGTVNITGATFIIK